MRGRKGLKLDEVVFGWARFSAQALVIVFYFTFFSAKALPQSGTNNGNTPEFDDDARPKTSYQITPTFAVGIQLETKVTQEVDFDSYDEDSSFVEPKARWSFSYEPASNIRTSLELDGKREFGVSAPNDQSDSEWLINLRRAYVALSDVIGGATTTLGRQQIEDKRAWLIEKELDGAHSFWAKSKLGFEVAAARKDVFRRNLLESNDDGKGETAYLLATNYQSNHGNRTVRNYLLNLRDGDGGREDLTFIGVQSIGQLNEHSNYWVDAAHVRGKRQGIDIRGYAVDSGVTYKFDVFGKPSITAGIAFGSGDNNPDDGVDNAFRQTGLQKNNAKISGLPKIQYYGSTLDPELSNLIVATAAAGLRPTKRSSVELIYHHYWQHKAVDHFRDVAIDKTPEGIKKELGSGLDIIFGTKLSPDWVLEATASAFFPGKAFSNEENPAYFFEFKIKFLL